MTFVLEHVDQVDIDAFIQLSQATGTATKGLRIPKREHDSGIGGGIGGGGGSGGGNEGW